MFDLSGRKPTEISLNFVDNDQTGERKAVLDESGARDGIRIDSQTMSGLFSVLRRERASVLQIGDLQLTLKEEKAFTLIAVTRQGIQTALRCSVPKGGVRGQAFHFTSEGEILLDRGRDDVTGAPVKLYPLPNQTMAIRRPKFDQEK